jgi:hypothetical protein
VKNFNSAINAQNSLTNADQRHRPKNKCQCFQISVIENIEVRRNEHNQAACSASFCSIKKVKVWQFDKLTCAFKNVLENTAGPIFVCGITDVWSAKMSRKSGDQNEN